MGHREIFLAVYSASIIILGCVVLTPCLANEPIAEPPLGDPVGYSAEQAAYWRQDEIRETMLAHVEAEGLAVPQWPNMSLATPKVEIAVPIYQTVTTPLTNLLMNFPQRREKLSD